MPGFNPGIERLPGNAELLGDLRHRVGFHLRQGIAITGHHCQARVTMHLLEHGRPSQRGCCAFLWTKASS